jgi:hypothetical protein
LIIFVVGWESEKNLGLALLTNLNLMLSSKFDLDYFVGFIVHCFINFIHLVGLSPMIRCFAIKLVQLDGVAQDLRGLLGLEEVERDCFGHSLNSIFSFYKNLIDQKCFNF